MNFAESLSVKKLLAVLIQEDTSNKTQGPLIQRFHKLQILRDLLLPCTCNPSTSNLLTPTMGLINPQISVKSTCSYFQTWASGHRKIKKSANSFREAFQKARSNFMPHTATIKPSSLSKRTTKNSV